MDISVIVPMYNEQENAETTIDRLSTALDSTGLSWEIIVVDDGSTDETKSRVLQTTSSHKRVRLVSYFPNRGRGRALRAGFAEAKGEIVCTVDADLSYDESHVVRMVEALKANPEVHVVLGSPYMQGGKTVHVPLGRLLPSRVGNRILGACLGGRLATVTGILRAYRRECITSLELESDGKEIHLEILSKVLAMGYKVMEIPATLRSRERGRSKGKVGRTSISHLIFSFQEKPAVLFGMIGFALIILGLVVGGYVIYLWRIATLNPERPLMNLLLLLVLTGFQILLFGFLATQIVHLRRELYRMYRKNTESQEQVLRRLSQEPPPAADNSSPSPKDDRRPASK